MKIPFVDLKAQYLSIESEIDEAIKSVILDSAFIKGKYVLQFEKEFAEYCGTGFCILLQQQIHLLPHQRP
jgi:dTDP-4-amino-4,6-dideoxygalactose transaminase